MFYQKHFPCFAAGKPRYTVPQNILSKKNHYGICKILRMRELCIKFKK